VGIGKSRDGHAILIDADHTRIRVERKVEGLGRRYLRDQADIRDGRPVAVAEDPARRMFGEQRLNRLQAGVEPMLDPGESLLIAIGSCAPSHRSGRYALSPCAAEDEADAM
jgi:hypothetical protein